MSTDTISPLRHRMIEDTAARSSNLRANTIAASAPIQATHASRRAQIPIACTAPSAHDRSRFRALALFGRRPIERVAAIVFTGIQKPAQSTKHKPGSRPCSRASGPNTLQQRLDVLQIARVVQPPKASPSARTRLAASKPVTTVCLFVMTPGLGTFQLFKRKP